MFVHEVKKRIRYSETDKMGYLYYGNYAALYEIGRVEALRSIGITYRSMEDEYHVMMPVAKMNIKYIRPAYYDDIITIKTAINSLPDRSIAFRVELFNELEELINIAEVELAFVDTKTKGRISIPTLLKDKLQPYFEQ